MSLKPLLMAGFATLIMASSPAFAFTAEQMPKDSTGAQFADPDEKFEDTASKPANGSAMQFNAGDATFSIWNGNGQTNDQTAPPADSARTGEQMADPALRLLNSRH